MNEAQAKPGTDWDRITAISAVLIGLVAVAVSAYTALIQRQQVRAEVWPRLLMYNAGQAGEFRIANKGVGPAMVRSVRVEVDGKPAHSWGQVLERLRLQDPGQSYSSLAGLVLSAGEDLVYLKPSSHERFLELRRHAGKRLRIKLCYCSALDECWTTQTWGESLEDAQREVARCPAMGPDEFYE
ncbi:hypothetical protein FCE95_06680 [Luteimonas gilva]|uniref:Uncharacterized protein n=1 Tax=Luteimonas gilva TaxID=2572684 RepID=A0A4U5JVH9_9GAMM|nr:hypothetical protein [Luteimonas gilva]TKR33950.1 hypothetical protein FCE95_06680 [Luteimonas gilva]